MTNSKSGISVKKVNREPVEHGVEANNGLSANGIVHRLGDQVRYWDWDEPFPREWKRQILENPEIHLRGLPPRDRERMLQAMEEMAEEMGADPERFRRLR